MKHIHQVLKEITKQAEFDIPRIDNFLKSSKGPKFVERLGRTQIDILEHEFGITKMYTKDSINKLGLWINRAKKLGLAPPVRNTIIKDYGESLKKMKESGKLKLPHTLTKKEIYKQIHSVYKRDSDGNRIQQKDYRGRLLWNEVNNIPIYKRKARREAKKGLSEALKCHLYEMHKMAKWDKRNPMPSLLELKYTLFPQELFAAYRTRRHLYNEYVRNALAEKYCNSVPTKETPLRLFSVHEQVGYEGQRVSWEQECNPLICGNSWLSLPDINSKLQHAAKNIADKSVVALKIYDMFGNERARIAA